LLFSKEKKCSKNAWILLLCTEVKYSNKKIIEIYSKIIGEIDKLLINVLQKESDLDSFELKACAMALKGMIFDLFLTNEILSIKSFPKEEIEHILSVFVKIISNSLKR
jgi:hypothetical protein